MCSCPPSSAPVIDSPWTAPAREGDRARTQARLRRPPAAIPSHRGACSLASRGEGGEHVGPGAGVRVQGESALDFVSRLLEEAGISYSWKGDSEKGSELVLHDAPHTHEPREGGPITHNDSPNQSAEREFIGGVRLSQQVRPGKVTLRDHD